MFDSSSRRLSHIVQKSANTSVEVSWRGVVKSTGVKWFPRMRSLLWDLGALSCVRAASSSLHNRWVIFPKRRNSFCVSCAAISAQITANVRFSVLWRSIFVGCSVRSDACFGVVTLKRFVFVWPHPLWVKNAYARFRRNQITEWCMFNLITFIFGLGRKAMSDWVVLGVGPPHVGSPLKIIVRNNIQIT